jgi:DNA-binding NarL/FixJ family response regulator
MDTGPEVKTLSERELEVLKLSAEGHSLKQIAVLLNISEDTVDTHSRNVVNKLNAKNMKHAIANAFRKRVII